MALNPNYSYAKHIQLVEKKLLEVYSGKCKRLIINLPPRHGKTMLVRYFNEFHLINKMIFHKQAPHLIYASYQQTFGENEVGDKVLQDLENLNIKLRRKSTKYIELSGGGLFEVSSIEGALTGKGADVLEIDDPFSNDSQAHSKTYRDGVYDWYRGTAYDRLTPEGAIIIMMTRWHQDDLVGRLLDEEEKAGVKIWDKIILPAFAKSYDPIGRAEGEALWDDEPNGVKRFGVDRLLDIRKTIGEYFFNAKYQQEPISSEYQILKPQWWQFFDSIIGRDGLTVQFWDTAVKPEEKNDFSVCGTMTTHSGGLYLTDFYRDKIDFPDLLQQAIFQYEKNRPAYVLIEDASSGSQLIQYLKKHTNIPIKAIPTMNKTVRAHLAAPMLESGKVFLHSGLPYVSEIINECSAFPNGKNDDIVDVVTNLILYLQKFIESVDLNSGNSNYSNMAYKPTPNRAIFRNY